MRNKLYKFIVILLFLTPIFFFKIAREARAGCTFQWACPPGQCWACPGGPWCNEYEWGAWCDRCINNWLVAFACDNCGQCSGCFVEGTEIETKSQSDRETEGQSDKEIKEIQNLEPGDVVSSFNPETGEISESQVVEAHKLTREGYYELETESGKKVKVTGEHPFLAVKSEENLISKLKNALSNTLTFRLITGLQAKLVEILD